MTVDGSPTLSRAGAAQRDQRWYLADEREFLLRSLDDAEPSARGRRPLRRGPRGAGGAGLGPAGRGRGRAGDPGPRAVVGTGVGRGSTPEDAGRPPPGRLPLPLWRRVGIVAACLLIVAGVGILVAHSVQARQPGQPSSGSISLSQAQLIEQQLQQAPALNNNGNTKAALELYDKVLSEDPSNPAALAYAGYLQWNIGSHGARRLPGAHRARRDRDGGQGLADLLPGPPLLRARAREPGPRRRGGRGPVQRLPGRRAAVGRGRPGRPARAPAPTRRRGTRAGRLRERVDRRAARRSTTSAP